MIEPFGTLRGSSFDDIRPWNWLRRDKWPSNSPDEIFMGHAIDRLGRVLFGDQWNMREPEGAPVAKRLSPTWDVAPEHERMEVGMRTARTRELFRQGEFITKPPKGTPAPELTPEEWADAVAERDEKRERWAASHRRWAEVQAVFEWPLRRGEIETRTRGADKSYFLKADEGSWNIDSFAGRFTDLRMNPRAPNDHHSGDRGWIFFDRLSFDAFLRRVAAERKPPPAISSPFAFNRVADSFSLFDAAIWAATSGEDTTTGDIAEKGLDEAGARLLFPLLARRGAPILTGLNDRNLRVPVDPAYWEMAHTGWRGEHGHRVLFLEPDPNDSDCDNELIPYRSTVPKWRAIRIDSAELFALVPDPNAAPATKLGAKPYGWPAFDAEADRLLDYYGMPGPDEPDLPNQAALERKMREWAKAKWGKSPSEARIRHQVRGALQRLQARIDDAAKG